jgi:GT2 family glycosyltransferase
MNLGISLVLHRESSVPVLESLDALAQSMLSNQICLAIWFNEATKSPVKTDHWRESLADRYNNCMQYKYVERVDNWGYTGGHNNNIEYLSSLDCGAVVVINPDVCFSVRDIVGIIEACSRGASYFAPILHRMDTLGTPLNEVDSLGIRWTQDGRHLDIGAGLAIAAEHDLEPIRGVTGAFLVISSSVIDSLTNSFGEVFDNSFFAYREDADLGLVLEAFHVPAEVATIGPCYHIRKQRGTQRIFDDVNYWSVRNRYLLMFKHGCSVRGNTAAVIARDLAVLIAVLFWERESKRGPLMAFRLRRSMRDKRRLLRCR